MRITVNLRAAQKVYRGLFPLLEQWLLPARCTLCDAPGHDRLELCPGCHDDLPWNLNACIHCAHPLPESTSSPICGHCLHPDKSRPCDHAWTAFIYKEPLPWLVTRLKFQAQLQHARLLSALMWSRLKDPLAHQTAAAPDLIMPVPLHPTRLRERGFNQALEIARPIAKASGIPLDDRSLRRIRATERQSELSQTARQRNLHKAFACRRSLQGLHVALVDDVMTSGNTIRAATQALKHAGADRVTAWVAARAIYRTT